MKCPICHSDNVVRNNIVSCASCSHIFRNYPLINLKKYYTETYRQTNAGGTLDFSKLKKRNTLRLIKTFYLLKDKKSFFEVGLGYGDFYKILKTKVDKNNLEFSGCELDENLFLKFSAENKDLHIHNCSFQEVSEEKTFDVVMSFDVLEHFYNPHDYKQKLDKILNKEGIAIIQIPTDRAIYYNEEHFDGHYHYFSSQSLDVLMGENYEKVLFYKSERGELANGKEFLTAYRRKR